MTERKIYLGLSKFGNVEVMKLGANIFTLLISGKGLSSLDAILDIQETLKRFDIQTDYPKVEVMKNKDSFLLMVLKR